MPAAIAELDEGGVTSVEPPPPADKEPEVEVLEDEPAPPVEDAEPAPSAPADEPEVDVTKPQSEVLDDPAAADKPEAPESPTSAPPASKPTARVLDMD